MNRSGGITYLIKHGRAPMAGVTRTSAPSTGIKKYAAGGAPINAPLNYAEVPDYVFNQASDANPEYDKFGQRIHHSGTYAHRTKDAAGLPTANLADPMSMIGQGGGGVGSGHGGWKNPDAVDTNWREITGDSTIPEGAKWGELTTDQKRTASAIVDKYGIGQGIADIVKASPLGMMATKFGGWADKALGKETQEQKDATARAAYEPGGRGPLTGSAWAYDGSGGTSPAQNAGGSSQLGPGPSQETISAGAAGQAAEMNRQAAENQRAYEAQQMAQQYRQYNNPNAGTDSDGDASTSSGSAPGGGAAAGGLSMDGHIRHMAAGGIGSLAEHGGYSISHAAGGRMLRGPGDGLSDNIPAVIGKNQPARLADGEFVVSADVVSALGGGSTEAGSKKLYAMMDRIRKSAHGTKTQVKKVNDHKVLPA